MSAFYAAGYHPRIDPQGEQRLEEWLRQQVRSGYLNRDHPHFRQPMAEHRTAAHGIHWEMYIWNYVDMRVAEVPSKGYIQLLRSTNDRSVLNDNWYAIRCMPPTQEEYYLWRFGCSSPPQDQRASARELQMHLGYNRQYNLTLQQRIGRYHASQRGLCHLHSQIVSELAALGRNLIAIACFQLAINVGSGGAMNPVPIAGELAGRRHSRR